MLEVKTIEFHVMSEFCVLSPKVYLYLSVCWRALPTTPLFVLSQCDWCDSKQINCHHNEALIRFLQHHFSSLR